MSRSPVDLNTYDDVPVSALRFDPAAGWASVPPALFADWLEVVARVARVIAREYQKPDLPDVIAFRCETIASDGPTGRARISTT